MHTPSEGAVYGTHTGYPLVLSEAVIRAVEGYSWDFRARYLGWELRFAASATTRSDFHTTK
jgi:hypothetical protein